MSEVMEGRVKHCIVRNKPSLALGIIRGGAVETATSASFPPALVVITGWKIVSLKYEAGGFISKNS